MVLIKGFGFSGYRSFGEDLAKIGPLKKVNFIIGQNNTGKSNIVNFLHKQYPYFAFKTMAQRPFGAKADPDHFAEIDHHISTEKVNHRISFLLPKSEIEEHLDRVMEKVRVQGNHRNLARKLIESDVLVKPGEELWITFSSARITSSLSLEVDPTAVESALTPHEWSSLRAALNTSSVGRFTKSMVLEVLKDVLLPPPRVPEIVEIPAIRKIGEAGSVSSDYSGDGIIERLASLEVSMLPNVSPLV